MQLHVFKTPESFSKGVADWMVDYIRDTLSKQEKFTLVLSGGGTPKALYELLASPAYRDNIEWNRLHIFWGDERDVPYSDPRNNAKMAFETLLDKVPIPAGQVHIMKTENITPADSARAYDEILHQYFPHADANTGQTFDLVLLGMGEDGHTLSLFPGTAIIHENKAWTGAYYLEAQQMYRITLTKAVVNQSGRIAFLTMGSNKATALKEVLEGAYNPDLYPSQEIKPQSGELHWFVDEAAAALL